MLFKPGELVVDCDGYIGIVLEVDALRNISTHYTNYGERTEETVSLVLVYSFERHAKLLFYSSELSSIE